VEDHEDFSDNRRTELSNDSDLPLAAIHDSNDSTTVLDTL